MKHSRGLVIGISNVCQLTADNRCWPGRRSPRCQPRTHQNSPVKKKLAPGYHRVSFSLNRQLLPAWGAAAAPRKPRNSYHFCSSFSTPPNALSLPCKCVTIDILSEWRSAVTKQNPGTQTPSAHGRDCSSPRHTCPSDSATWRGTVGKTPQIFYKRDNGWLI